MHKNVIMFLEKGTKAWLSHISRMVALAKSLCKEFPALKTHQSVFWDRIGTKPFTLHHSFGIPCIYRGFRGWRILFHPSSPFIHRSFHFFSVCYALNFPNFPICKSTVMNLFCQLRINLCSKLSNISSKLWDTSSKLSNISSKL